MHDFNPPGSFLETLEAFDFETVAVFENDAESLRQETLRRYPLESWPTMHLEEYAQGQGEAHPDNLCRWLEFQTRDMGSIGGGSARKLIISKKRNEPGWRFSDRYANEREAWEDVRAGFIESFKLAQGGNWDEIDGIEALSSGPALRTKVLYVYFPDEILPIFSDRVLRHFLETIGDVDGAGDESLGRVALNRRLLNSVRAIDQMPNASTKALERFFFRSFNPLGGRVFKIAPGRQGKYWEDCLAGGYMCVGWDEVGDLTLYESRDSFRSAFGDTFEHNARKSGEKAKEVWALLELEEGDTVVANRGTQEILGLGRVIAPGYKWADEREEYKHTVAVEWFSTESRSIPKQASWAFKTVKELKGEGRRIALGEDAGQVVSSSSSDDPVELSRVEAGLDAKRQVLLYGPPGTGKTWLARQIEKRWRAAEDGAEQSSTALPAATERRAWLVVASSKQGWKWNDLFTNGPQTFSRGRVSTNFAEIQKGDIVFGYAAHPAKRIQAIATVKDIELPASGRTFTLEGVTEVADGPRFDEMQADAALATSQPLINGMQGTLFRLEDSEWLSLTSLIAARDESAPEALEAEGLSFGATGADAINAVEWVTFHPSYSYEDFVEGFRPVKSSRGVELRLRNGIFKRVCAEANSFPDRKFMLIIDEINRANVSSVFGELITLIEADKRGEMSINLPYSGEQFSVPPNVYLVGTMNTADRSIRLIDTALRRRFAFVEVMPDPSVVSEGEVDGLKLEPLLENLNQVVVKLAGREKQIGHSFLMKEGEPISLAEDLARAFRTEIIPLLQEYAADDWDRLAGALGPKLVDSDALRLNFDVLDDPTQLLEAIESRFGSGDTSSE